MWWIVVACAKPDPTETHGPSVTESGLETEPPTETAETETETRAVAPWQYRFDTFRSYTLEEEGIDLDEDGTPDNAAPSVLALVDALLEEDTSVEALNARIADAMAAGTLVLLAEAVPGAGEAVLDLLTGLELGRIYLPDPVSYDAYGVPVARLEGPYVDGTLDASADRIVVSIPFFEGSPVPIPLERARAIGPLDADRLTVDVYGAIPTDELLDLVVLPLLVDTFPDPKQRAAYLEVAELMLGPESTLADVDLGDGRRGISAAFAVLASPTVW